MMISNSLTSSMIAAINDPQSNTPSGPPSLKLGATDKVQGILFRKYATFLKLENFEIIPNIQQVLLVHERGMRNQPKIVKQLSLKFTALQRLITIAAPTNEDLQTIEDWEVKAADGFGKNVWKIVVKTDHVKYSELSVEISYICDGPNDIAKTPYEYLMRRYKYFAREFELFESANNRTLFESLFNKDKPGFEKFFGKFYPLVCTVKGRWNRIGSNDGKIEIVGDGLSNISILNSFSRFARILMGLNLGKCLMLVKFDLQSNEDKMILSECKKEYCISFGITHEGHKYELFSTSNSGMKGDSALFFNSTLLNIEVLKQLLGTFEKAESHSTKKAAIRVGLSLGTSTPSLAAWKLDEIQLIDDDIAVTDGIGLAVDDFFEEMLATTYSVPYFFLDDLLDSEQKHKRLFVIKYKGVTAIQIRILGFKGVIQKVGKELFAQLLKKFNLPPNTKIILRKSMEKFNGNYSIYNKIDVLNVAREQGGSISRNVMTCLLQLSRREKELEQVFRKFYERELMEIVENKDDPEYLYNVILSQSPSSSHESMVRSMIIAGHPLDNYFISSTVKKCIEDKFESLIKDKLCFKWKHPGFVSLMGGFDESLTLKHDEVCINSSKLLNHPNYSQIQRVLVYRNPLAYEGDIQCFKLVKFPPNEFLQSRKDEIIFGHNPLRKSMPEPLCYMAGGDLDGDLYDIIFDPEIVDLVDTTMKPKLDYNEGVVTPPRNAKPFTMKEIRETTLSMMTNSSGDTGILFNMAINWRDDSSREGLLTKQKLSKLYHDSIDAVKGAAFNKSAINNIPRRGKPKWMDLAIVKLSGTDSTPQDTGFESRMFILIKEIFNKMTFESSLALDSDFENPSEIYQSDWPTWKQEFKDAHNEWKCYWSTLKNNQEILLADKFAAHKQILFEKIKECIGNDTKVNWEKLFINQEDSFEKLCHKAAYWLYHAYKQEIPEGNLQGDLEDRFRALIGGPFVYSYCLTYLNFFKTLINQEEDGLPQIVSPKFALRVKQTHSEKFTRTKID